MEPEVQDVAEEAQNEEAMSAFEEEEAAAPEPEDEGDETPEDDEKPEEPEPPAEDKDETAWDRLHKKADAIEEPEKPETPEEPEEPEEPKPKEAPKKNGAEDFEARLDTFVKDFLDRDDVPAKVREFAEDFPDEFRAQAALRLHAEDQKKDAPPEVDPREVAYLRNQYHHMNTMATASAILAQRGFTENVAVVNMDPEFAKFIQSDPKLKRLAQNVDAETAADLVQAFREKQAADAVGKKDSKDREKKGRHDSIHRHTLRSKATGKFSSEPDKDDAKAAFEEDDDD